MKLCFFFRTSLLELRPRRRKNPSMGLSFRKARMGAKLGRMTFVISVVEKVLEKTFRNTRENSLTHNANDANRVSVSLRFIPTTKSTKPPKMAIPQAETPCCGEREKLCVLSVSARNKRKQAKATKSAVRFQLYGN